MSYSIVLFIIYFLLRFFLITWNSKYFDNFFKFSKFSEFLKLENFVIFQIEK